MEIGQATVFWWLRQRSRHGDKRRVVRLESRSWQAAAAIAGKLHPARWAAAELARHETGGAGD